MKKICFVLIALVFLVCSCATTARRMINGPSEVGAEEVIITGKIIVHPGFTRDEQDLTGSGAEDYRNLMLVLNKNKYKKINTAKTQELTGKEWEGRIASKMGETFYAAFPDDEQLYLLSGAVCTKYYWVTIPGTISWMNRGNGMMTMVQNPPRQELHTKFEYIPFNYKVVINPGDKAVYIGDINVYRDEFNKIKKVEVADNYVKEAEVFKKKFGNIKLKKAFAKTAPDSELIQPTEADNFMDSGFRNGYSGGYSINMNGSKGYVSLDAVWGYQFNRNLTADIAFGFLIPPDFFSFVERDFGNGVTLGTIDVPMRAGLKYFIFDGTFSTYALGRLGAAIDMSAVRGGDEMFKIYMLSELGLGMRFSLDTHFDLMLEADMLFYNFVPCMVVPKLVLMF